MPVRIAILGAAGRMGETLARLIAAAPDLELLAGIDREAAEGGPGGARIVRLEDAAEVVAAADVVLDFSAPEATAMLLERLAGALAGRALAVGTTGLGPEALDRLERAAGRTAVLVASNFSVGVNLLVSLVEQAALVLAAADYDVEIVETHHRRKADAPSGTAITLAETVARARGDVLADVRRDGRTGRPGERPAGEIGVHALRGGEVAGEHRVHFIGARERLELAHAAGERTLFADGALLAARWLAGKPAGRYTMREVLGL